MSSAVRLTLAPAVSCPVAFVRLRLAIVWVPAVSFVPHGRARRGHAVGPVPLAVPPEQGT